MARGSDIWTWSEEAEELYSSAKALLAARGGFQLGMDLWPEIASLGWCGIGLPEDLGGSGGGVEEICSLSRALGEVAAPISLVGSAVATACLSKLATEDAARLAAEIAEGTRVAIADPQACSGLFLKDARLEGSISFATDALRTGLLLGFTQSPSRAVVIVSLGSPDSSLVFIDGVEPVRSLGVIDCMGVLPSMVIEDQVVIENAFALARLCLAGELLGVADSSLSMTISHVSQRRQFDRPIGSFQALGHGIVECAIQTEQARSLLIRGVKAFEEASEQVRLSAMAKAACGRAAIRAASLAVHCLGAMGLTAEHPAHLLLRRAWFADQFFGDSARCFRELGCEALTTRTVAVSREGRDSPWTEAVEEFRNWLKEFLPKDYKEQYLSYRWDEKLRREYQISAFEAGWLMPSWPSDLGGRQLDPLSALAIRVEAATWPAPKLMNIQGPNVVAPAIMAYGTQEQKDCYLKPVLRGEEWWALGMSEPDAGSDLASLRTRAREEGNGFVVEGQKIWTTQADQARWCLLLARSEEAVPKHAGISCLIVDMASPGIRVSRIPMAAGERESFCEVFFDRVFVPEENLIGQPGQGWEVANKSLESERDMIWLMNATEIDLALRMVVDSGGSDGLLSVALGELLTEREALHATGWRVVADAGSKRVGYMLKLMASELLQRCFELARSARGIVGMSDAELIFESLTALGATIYGGTSEIQRDIVARRVLGLPRG
jgi:alkylation response protein AidB-like acyl-CoA dehydrogenase